MAQVNTQELISRNTTIRAREAAARFPQHKEYCQKFINSFEKREGEPDPKFGFLKYKAALRKAMNRHQDTIFIDLDDLEQFCQETLEGPGAGGSQASASNPKMQLQRPLHTLITDVESNTLRYAKFFYEACDVEKPGRDEGLNRANVDGAQETIQKWRERNLMRAQESGQPVGEVPPQLRNPFTICFKPREGSKALKLREVGAQYVGSLVTLDCLVVRCSEVKPRVEVVTYQCEICESEVFQSVEAAEYSPPKECPSQQCRLRNQSGKLRPNNRTSKFGKYQEMRVQEMSEHVPVGGVPRGMNVVLAGDLCRSCSPGDAITLTGIFRPQDLPWFQQRQKGTSQEMYVDAQFVRKHKRGYNDASVDEQAVAKKVEDAFASGDMYEKAAKSIGPNIFGHYDVKKALLLSLIGAFTKTMKDGMKIRGEIHCLFMGDPGVAKSQLMKQACAIAPRSVYTTGKGSSGVGLTASVVRDNVTGEVSLEGGALVLADMGICCIDEFDKMEEGDRTAIHEVMEQQSVSIAKAGITTTLNTRTTILAAANPVMGRYDPYKSPVENIDLPPALLSRFDLLFLLLDTVDNDKDHQLAKFVCKVHSVNNNAGQEDETAGGRNAAATVDELDLGFVPFDADFMRSYIRRAKTYEPLIDDSLQKDIVDAYVSMRDDDKHSDLDSRKSYTTPRTLLAILRLAQAHARARFSNKVERGDFEEAMRLMKASKESVETVSPKKQTNPMELVYEVMQDLARRSPHAEGWVEIAQIISMSGHKALNAEQVKEAIEQWENLSVLCQNPEQTMVKFMVPTS